MKTEIEALAGEVRQIQKKSKRPKYTAEFIDRVVKLMGSGRIDFSYLASSLGIGRDTLRRWHRQSLEGAKAKSAPQRLTFSPVLAEGLPSKVARQAAGAEQMIRLDFSHRDGRRMVLELPATKVCCGDLLGSLRQDFFGGC